MRKAKVMRRLIDELVDDLGLPVPAEPDDLFVALVDLVSRRTGRELVLLQEEFPYRTASGLWLDLPDRDVIVVDKRATPLHRLAIFFHEIWHMLDGACGHHVPGGTVAGGLLSARADLPRLDETVRRVAARTEFDHREEAAAEKFGLLAVTRFRVWLEGEPDGTPPDRGEIAGRISASLGDRRRKA
ncbi:toxin-antitoxin system, toxin component [Streptomyces sp. NPDC005813]|uniref:toxin-antitoxin system, toxin component n=1 Tax=Streptomyces sp. NPDC005813 TaxID=3155592 RepID=UPI0033DDD1D9